MSAGRQVAVVAGFLACAAVCSSAFAEDPADSGVIRLSSPQTSDNAAGAPDLANPSNEGRRGFDYRAFGERLEGYWFQRKAHLKEGRDEDALRQAVNIGSFVKEEGIRRLESPSGALLAEANRYAREGNYLRARQALALAEMLDPGRPQTRFLNARVAWDSDAGAQKVAKELVAGTKAAVSQVASQPDATRSLALKIFVALMVLSVVFPLMMIVRHQAAVRHEVEEWLTQRGHRPLALAGGWAWLLAPLVLWIGAGWIAIWWIVITFRFMRRSERVVTAVLLLLIACAVPGYRVAVGLYGLSTDPKVRTTVAAAGGAYEPDRIVKLQELVEAYPDDPTYQFLLAGLYKNGRFLEEAFEKYGSVLQLAPETWQARVNIGNIYFQTGQYAEAIAQYRQAIAMRPNAVIAYCNMYLAQTESLKLNEAAATLEKARAIDAAGVARLLSPGGERRERATVTDATIDLAAIWRAALEGRKLEDWLTGEAGQKPGWGTLAAGLLNPLSIVALAALVTCGIFLFVYRAKSPAGRCVKCGAAYCSHCRIRREEQPYCSQCMHLFVLQDGLAPETKTRKLYEIESYQKRSRIATRIGSLIAPGSGFLMKGRAIWGTLLILAWLAAVIAFWPGAAGPVERLLGFDVRVDLLRTGPVPNLFDLDPTLLLAIPLGLAAWLAGNVGLSRPREA